jgi:uncharacterized protein with FMN-binding domain
LIIPVGNAVAATKAVPKVVVTTKTVNGPEESVDRWGNLKITLVVKKTTTTIGTKKTVKRKITKVTVPESPNHTSRSVYINDQALPLLVQETLQLQFNLSRFQLVSGATDSSYAFGHSLQAALLAAKKV